MSPLDKIEMHSLLGRDQIDLTETHEYIKNMNVLVTGGAGSIGSELCRQILKSKPKKLVIIDNHEFSLFNIQQELKNNKNIECIILDIKNLSSIKRLFAKYNFDLVFQAAAYKHVPLMEDNFNEAVQNNIIGTKNILECSDEFFSKLVFISTDKACNPINIMGATKRISEMIIQSNNNLNSSIVRFGNVLGSNGSVIPIFKKQIEDGGPITVTHPDTIRYFMTIPEAVNLVLHAGSFKSNGDIFILDMGEQIKILDLAKQMLNISGRCDIKIEFIGMRPGEKMYEELHTSNEYLENTTHIKINKIRNVNQYELFQFNIFNKYFESKFDLINEFVKFISEFKNEGKL